MHAKEPRYTPEIDGLRAIAVLSVVLFHAGFPGFSAGYLGVDIFFVISGFLITRLLVDELDRTGSLDFRGFYARRIRRLLPSLALMLVVTLIAAVFILFPGELPRLAKSATAVVLMVSNLHFMKYAGGYFAPAVDVMPLLHTWSLSVEEQFYLFWPLLVLLVFRGALRLGLNVRRLLIGVFSCLSLASLWFWQSHYLPEHSLAFYAMPSRVWQLGLGAILAVAWRQDGKVQGCVLPQVAANLFLPLLLLVLLFPAANESEGAYLTVAATLLAGLLLSVFAASASGQTLAGRLLASAPMTAIGRVSYGWYLWHWPLLALTRSYFLGEKLLWRDTAAVLLALLIAWLSARYLENPIRFRRPGPFARSKSTLLAGFSILLALALCAEGVLHWGRNASRAVDQEVLGLASGSERCPEPADGRSLAPQEGCMQGRPGGPVSMLAWGDSHAGHLRGLLEDVANDKGQRYVLRTFGACPPLLGVAPVKNGQVQAACGEHNDQVAGELTALAAGGLRSVVLAGRWNAYLGLPETNPAAINSYALVRDWRTAGSERLKVGVSPLDHAGSLDSLRTGLRQTLSELDRLGIRVLLVAPVPEPYFNAAHCVHRRSPEDCIFSREKVEARRAATLTALQEAAAGFANVRMVDPIDNFCDQTWCYVYRDGALMYGDTDHMTARMSRQLRTSWQAYLNWLWHEE